MKLGKKIRLKKKAKDFYNKIFGVFLILLGVIGALLPVIPGFVFVIAGLSLISKNYSRSIQFIVMRYKVHKRITKFFTEFFEVTLEAIKSIHLN